MVKLSVHLVAWNGAKYIPYLFKSLRNQTFSDLFLLVIDNNSTDGTVEAIKNELINFSIPYRLIENKENFGFAGGHNQAYKETDSEYVLLLNQDMYLEPDCLEKMVEFLNKYPATAAVSPRLMKWDFAKAGEGLEKSFSDHVDALGLKIFRNRRVIEQYTREKWEEIKQKFSDKDYLEVFGVSGAFPMYRRSTLQDVVFSNGDFLDSSYHSYKEDVDLAYRLVSRGWKSFVLLDTAAYHDRSGAGPKEFGDCAALANKKTHSPWVRYHSYKNHIMTLYKNEYWQNFILDFPWILWYESKKFIYFLLFDRQVLAGLGDVWKLRQELRQKRAQIKKLRRINYKEIRKYEGY